MKHSKKPNSAFTEQTKNLIHQLEDRLPQLAPMVLNALCGDENATMMLVEVASLSTRALEEVSQYHVENVRRWAREDWAFPLMVSPHPEFLEAAHKRVKLLEVGKDTYVPAPGVRRPWSIKTPANRIVLGKMIQIAQVRAALRDSSLVPQGKKLPWSSDIHAIIIQLTESPGEDRGGWFAALWKAVLDENEDHPEQNGNLAKLGSSRKDHYISVARREGASAKTQQANIRDGIKKTLRQAFDRIIEQSIPIKG